MKTTVNKADRIRRALARAAGPVNDALKLSEALLSPEQPPKPLSRSKGVPERPERRAS